MVKQLEPRVITAAADGSLSRMAGLSMRGAPPGDYTLMIRVIDEASGKRIDLHEPFALLPAQRAQ